jgi:hypothetical protein
MLASSLLRTYFPGDIMIFRNSAAPLFLVERKSLEEIYIETPPLQGRTGAEAAWCWKYRVAPLIPHPEQYDRVLFLDCDCLVLRNLDGLLAGDWDVRFQPERGKPGNGPSFNAFLSDAEMNVAGGREGVNSGTLAVRGSQYREVMEAWREIDESNPRRSTGFRDQASWNALLQRHSFTETPRWRAEPFPDGEIQFPGYLDPDYTSYRRAALTHNILPDSRQKAQFTFGLYMQTFYFDPTGLFLSMLEV